MDIDIWLGRCAVNNIGHCLREACYCYFMALDFATPAWAVARRQPFFIRSLHALRSLGFDPPVLTPVPGVSPVPPWTSFDTALRLDFGDSFKKSTDGATARLIFLERDAKLCSVFFRIFTDGSRTEAPSAAAAA